VPVCAVGCRCCTPMSRIAGFVGFIKSTPTVLRLVRSLARLGFAAASRAVRNGDGLLLRLSIVNERLYVLEIDRFDLPVSSGIFVITRFFYSSKKGEGKEKKIAKYMVDPPVPTFPPASVDAQMSAVVSVAMSLACWLLNFTVAADLAFCGAVLRRCGDPRILALQFRGLSGLVAVLVYFYSTTAPAPRFITYSSGYAAGYTSWLIAFDAYHMVGLALAASALRVRTRTILIASGIQLLELLIIVPAFVILCYMLSLYSGDPAATTSVNMSTALTWAFSSRYAFIGLGLSVLPALALRRLRNFPQSCSCGSKW
jgi:hypothetical protein